MLHAYTAYARSFGWLAIVIHKTLQLFPYFAIFNMSATHRDIMRPTFVNLKIFFLRYIHGVEQC